MTHFGGTLDHVTLGLPLVEGFAILGMREYLVFV